MNTHEHISGATTIKAGGILGDIRAGAQNATSSHDYAPRPVMATIEELRSNGWNLATTLPNPERMPSITSPEKSLAKHDRHVIRSVASRVGRFAVGIVKPGYEYSKNHPKTASVAILGLAAATASWAVWSSGAEQDSQHGGPSTMTAMVEGQTPAVPVNGLDCQTPIFEVMVDASGQQVVPFKQKLPDGTVRDAVITNQSRQLPVATMRQKIPFTLCPMPIVTTDAEGKQTVTSDTQQFVAVESKGGKTTYTIDRSAVALDATGFKGECTDEIGPLCISTDGYAEVAKRTDVADAAEVERLQKLTSDPTVLKAIFAGKFFKSAFTAVDQTEKCKTTISDITDKYLEGVVQGYIKESGIKADIAWADKSTYPSLATMYDLKGSASTSVNGIEINPGALDCRVTAMEEK